MFWTALFPVVALPAALALPGAFHQASKRDYASTDVTLYAYGTNISGVPLVYGSADGFIYINPDNATSVSSQSVTWDIPSLSSSTTTSTVAKLQNGTSPGSMAISPTGGLYDNVLVASNSSADANITTTGLTVYGQQLIYYNGSSIQALFWAKPKDNFWVLTWNTDNEYLEDTTPVTLKTIAPASA